MSSRAARSEIGTMYAILHGRFIGKCLVLVEKTLYSYKFLLIPGDFKVIELAGIEFDTLFAQDKPYLDEVCIVNDEVVPILQAQAKEIEKIPGKLIKGVSVIH